MLITYGTVRAVCIGDEYTRPGSLKYCHCYTEKCRPFFSVLEMVANQGDVVILFPSNVMVYDLTEPHLLARKEVRLINA